ncbi:Essential recombination function protein [uncultured Caudovirales phage]|uniref:Essential recombination function protein n=1 Tax=uncultured Caudovirales phage TaxID=2100421 RepID=A0A6J5MSQ7_9CAUD|nr:Essential recombination function protein [uncultured Caudovirales phage]
MNNTIHKSESISNLIPALLKAQNKIENPTKDSFNPHHKSKFASLHSYIEATKRPLMEQGLVIIQGINGSGLNVGVDTMLAHSSGEWLSFSVQAECFTTRKDASGKIEKLPGDGQAIGSLTTYLRRYGIASLLNLVGEEDDDAEADRSIRDHSPSQAPARSAPSPAPAIKSPQSQSQTAQSGDPGSAVVMFGKHKGKTLSELGSDQEGRNYIDWLANKRELKNAPDGKPYRNDVIFTEQCRAFLASMNSTPEIEPSDDVPF